jgi:hypothetical protein
MTKKDIQIAIQNATNKVGQMLPNPKIANEEQLKKQFMVALMNEGIDINFIELNWSIKFKEGVIQSLTEQETKKLKIEGNPNPNPKKSQDEKLDIVILYNDGIVKYNICGELKFRDKINWKNLPSGQQHQQVFLVKKDIERVIKSTDSNNFKITQNNETFDDGFIWFVTDNFYFVSEKKRENLETTIGQNQPTTLGKCQWEKVGKEWYSLFLNTWNL